MYQKIKAKFKASPTIFYACSIVASWAGVGSLMNFRTIALRYGAVPAIIWAVFNSLAYGTITHNRARGTHLLEPMKAIVKKLMDEGKTVDEIGKQLGMKPEEIFRLSGFTKDEFLNMMTKDHPTYSKAKVIRSI